MARPVNPLQSVPLTEPQRDLAPPPKRSYMSIEGETYATLLDILEELKAIRSMLEIPLNPDNR
jgi:hypothetical protein